MNKRSIMHYMMGKYQISRAYFYRIYRKIKERPIDFRSLAISLQEYNFVGNYEPLEIDIDREYPNVLVATSEAMISAFK